MYTKELKKNLLVCASCGYHHRMSAYERIESLLDQGSFVEFDADLISENPLAFPGYEEKLVADRRKTNLNEAIVTGEGTIDKLPLIIGVMDARFRMASMGSVVGEKIARAIEAAIEKKRSIRVIFGFGRSKNARGHLKSDADGEDERCLGEAKPLGRSLYFGYDSPDDRRSIGKLRFVRRL